MLKIIGKMASRMPVDASADQPIQDFLVFTQSGPITEVPNTIKNGPEGAAVDERYSGNVCTDLPPCPY